MHKCMRFVIYFSNFSLSTSMYFRFIYLVGSDECEYHLAPHDGTKLTALCVCRAQS